MCSKRRGLVRESQVELSVSPSVSESMNLWSIEVLMHLKIALGGGGGTLNFKYVISLKLSVIFL